MACCCSIELTIPNLVFLGVLAFVLKTLYGVFQTWKVEKMVEKWSTLAPKDKVVLHTFPRAKPLPAVSPYALKTETFLRLAKIPYEVDFNDSLGPRGLVPWITYNGTTVTDSHLIIQLLKKKFDTNLNKGKTEEALAAARACRIFLENHFIMGLIQYRMVDNVAGIPDLVKVPSFVKLILPWIMSLISWRFQKRLNAQGIGLHDRSDIYELTEGDLRTVSTMLGNKKFFGGDDPCDDDCAVFGMISQAVWGLPGSSFERLVHGELTNLMQYCERMKELAWPDWEKEMERS